jgi:hypothetical protein
MSILLDPPQAGWNVGEWAKQQACRNRVFATQIATVDGFDTLLLDKAEKHSDRRAQREEQRVTDSLAAVQEILSLGGDYWIRLRDVARKHGLLSPEDDRALAITSAVPRKLPNAVQAAKALAVRKRVEQAGIIGPPR